jgi:HD-GYP domain-containing protein (c-di-GMP phosphodiesterase class II)
MNGSGYPAGLPADKILLEARILAAADVVEAMSSPRSYRPALDINMIIKEINENKGILYDTKVADACLKLLSKKKSKSE